MEFSFIFPIRSLIIAFIYIKIRIMIRGNWNNIIIFAFKDNTEQICTMIMIESFIVRFNPMMYSHRITKKYKSPTYKVWVICITQFFCPTYLKLFKLVCITTSYHTLCLLSNIPISSRASLNALIRVSHQLQSGFP